MQKKMKYDDLWIKDLTTFNREKLLFALENFFNQSVPQNSSKQKLIEKIEMEKQKKEKKFSLVIEIDAGEEKIQIPINLFRWQSTEGYSDKTYLAEIDNFTTKFNDGREIINAFVMDANSYFDEKEAFELKKHCKNGVPGYIDLKIIMSDGVPSKYDDTVDVAYKDNRYLSAFLEECVSNRGHKPYGFKPIYAYNSAIFGESINIVFSRKINGDENFRYYCTQKLLGSIWKHNKTYQSRAIRDLCEYGQASNQMQLFRKYKNIRIAAMLMNDYEKELRNVKRI